MLGLGFQRSQRPPRELLLSSLVSCFLVLLSHLALAMVPRLFPSLSLLAMLPVSVLVWVATIALGRGLRWLLGISALAPALVLFNILFLWGAYIAVIRQAMPSLLDAIFNAVCALLLFGLYRILSGDPGLVGRDPSCLEALEQNDSEAQLQYENSQSFSRVRYCDSCKTCVRGFDHHCYAFGNCIGSQKNHQLFMVLVSGFIIAEASYTMSATKFITKSLSMESIKLEGNFSGSLVISTMLFSVQQLLWQVPFLIWHIYCICVNIKTHEWINWRRYPEFQTVIQPHPGSPLAETRFTNPYDKGLFGNIRDFLKTKE